MRRHLSFANITSLMALVFAMGGTGYALTIPKNSVGSKQLRKNAVTGVKVKNRSLRASDFARGQLRAGPRGVPGAAGGPGLTGPAGAKGERGLQGVPGVVGEVTVARTDFALLDNATAGESVPCPAGTRVDRRWLRDRCDHLQRRSRDGFAPGQHGRRPCRRRDVHRLARHVPQPDGRHRRDDGARVRDLRGGLACSP